ncbi:hypothetical protein PF66_06303 [Pseudomonas asplenii]|uniref:Uncharacterized protein n=1 Tax=Pseudomonas asplenii TaxID=53407 RepID=A0A0M9GBZ0_9PSED|nr:hypothetical protein PF66_06303 [Pseudomonas fuscovaginae]
MSGIGEVTRLRPIAQCLHVEQQFFVLLISERRCASDLKLVTVAITEPSNFRQLSITPRSLDN